MKSDKAKALHCLSGQPILAWVLEALNKAQIRNVCVVIGHQVQVVKRALSDHKVWAHQTKQRGTADAVCSARTWLKRQQGPVLVLAGDVPLIQPETLQALMKYHQQYRAQATVLTMEVENPAG